MLNVRHNYASYSKYSLDDATVKTSTLFSTTASNRFNFLTGGILLNLKANFYILI